MMNEKGTCLDFKITGDTFPVSDFVFDFLAVSAGRAKRKQARKNFCGTKSTGRDRR